MDLQDTIFVIALLIIAFITVIGNILVILAVLSNRRLQNPANYLMVNLAVSDFFQGLITMPLRTAEVLNTGSTLVRCDVVISLVILFHSSSNFNLALIALDRFIAVFKPFAYANVVKTSSFKIVIAMSWFLSLIISGCPVAGWRRYSSDESGAVCRYSTTLTDEYLILYVILVDLMPLSVMLVTYTYIFRTTRRQISQIRAQEIAVNHAAVNQAFESRRPSKTEQSQSVAGTPDKSRLAVNSVSPAIHSELSSNGESTINNNNMADVGKNKGTPQSSNNRHVPLSTTRTRKATKTVLAIIGFFIVLCMPITIIDAIELWCKTCGKIPRPVITVALCMVAVNSCVNVFVYGGYNTDYRRAYWNVWHRARDAFLSIFSRTKSTVQSAQGGHSSTTAY